MKALSPCCPVPTGTGSVRMYPPPTLSPGDFVASCGTRGKEVATKRPQLGAFCLFPSFLPSPVAAKGEGMRGARPACRPHRHHAHGVVQKS